MTVLCIGLNSNTENFKALGRYFSWASNFSKYTGNGKKYEAKLSHSLILQNKPEKLIFWYFIYTQIIPGFQANWKNDRNFTTTKTLRHGALRVVPHNYCLRGQPPPKTMFTG